MMKSKTDNHKIFLSDTERQIVQQILSDIISGKTVVLFGSRATGKKLKPYSDIDLYILSDHMPEIREKAELEERFSSSVLPMKVDIVYSHNAPQFIKDAVNEHGIIIQNATS